MAIGVPSSVTQTPSSQNFAAMKRFVVDYVQGASDTELLDTAGRGINGGIDRLNMREWTWNVQRQDITLVASTSEYSIEADFKKPRKVHVLNSSDEPVRWLNWKPLKTWLDEHLYSQSDGDPEYYTVETPKDYAKMRLDPSPSTSYVSAYPTLRFYYHARVPHLANDADTLGAPPEVWALVAWYARWDMALVREQTAAQVDRAYAHWRELENKLIADDRNQHVDWEI